MPTRFRIRDRTKTAVELLYMLLYSGLQKLKRKFRRRKRELENE